MTMTKLLYLVFFNLKDIHQKDFFEKSDLKFQKSKFFFHISFKNKDSPDKSLPIFPATTSSVWEEAKEELNKQSGIELLTAKGISGSKSYFFKKRESKNNFWNSIPTSYLLQNHQNLKGRERKSILSKAGSLKK